MGKRAADKQITKDSASYSGDEDQQEAPVTREKAPEDVLSQRKIVTVKRGLKEHSAKQRDEAKSPKHESSAGIFGGLSGIASQPIIAHPGDESSPKSPRKSLFGGLSSLAKEEKKEEGAFSSLFSLPAPGEGLFASSSFSFTAAPSGGLFSTSGETAFPSFGVGESKPETPEQSEDEPEPEQPAATGAQSDEMEGEEQIYQNDCKLYKLTKEDNEGEGPMKWIEKCIGFVRLLKHAESGNIRLVVRMKGVYRLVLNVALIPKICKAEKQGNKSVRFNGIEDDGSLGMYRLNLITEDQQELFFGFLGDDLKAK